MTALLGRWGLLLLLGVADCVEDDVGDVVVGEGVLDFAGFAGFAAGGHDACGALDAQVLGDQRPADAEGGDEFMDALAALGQFAHTACRPDTPVAVGSRHGNDFHM